MIDLMVIGMKVLFEILFVALCLACLAFVYVSITKYIWLWFRRYK